MKNIIFKALTGFGQEREVFFSVEDLEKVQYAFLREKRVLLSNGQAVDGKYIQQIMPDWIRTMEWNPEYKLGADDMNEIKESGVESEACGLLAKAKERVGYMLSNGMEDKIGSGIELPELEKPSIELRGNRAKSMKELLTKNH